MKKLYHYTSINKLALILELRKIRFRRLDYLNDPHEGIANDFGSMAIYMFVSCWTKNPEENFALWNMYTYKMRGVRIELPLPIFNSYNIRNLPNFIISEEDYLDDDKGIFIPTALNEPKEIEYTDDKDKLFPVIQNKIGLKTSHLGFTKRTIWKVEDEVRYKMEIYPYDPNISKDYFPATYEKYVAEKRPPSISFYDVDINQNAFKKMQIVIGPKMEPGDRQIIESLVVKYNPTVKITESKLTGLIK